MNRAAHETPGSADAIAPANAAALAAFEVHLGTRPANTRNAYLRDARTLASLAGTTPFAHLAAPELRRFLASLHARGLEGRSLARILSSWRALFRFLLDHDTAMRDDPTAGLRAPKAKRRLPSALSPDEAIALVEIEDESRLALRDRAIFELAYSSGLRVSELSQLDIDRLDSATEEVRVWGKGSKERIVPIGQGAREALAAWLRVRSELAQPDEKSLFVSSEGGRITPRTIQRRLAEWAIRQGLNRHVHPHMLRHSFASHVLQSSGDLRAVQEMLGHASIASTQVYTHLDYQYLAKVYDAAHPRAKKK